MLRSRLGWVLVVAFGVSSAATAIAGIPGFHDGGDLHEGVGQADTKALQSGVEYTATGFPVGLRVRPPDSQWGGVQLHSGRFSFIQLHHKKTGKVPLHGVGYITIEAAQGSTPSAATVISRLHATPHIRAGAITATRIANYAGQSFDATIVGTDKPPYCQTHPCSPGVSFAPFAVNQHCGYCTNTMHGETQDVKFAATKEVFRIMAITVQGKTIVIYLEANYADQPKYPPAKIFPTFLPYAQQLLSSLKIS